VNADPADHLAGSAGSAYSPLAPSEEPAEQRDPPEHPMESGILRNARRIGFGCAAIPSAHSFTIVPPWTRAIVIASRFSIACGARRPSYESLRRLQSAAPCIETGK
jgi:hypothetical protein